MIPTAALIDSDERREAARRSVGQPSTLRDGTARPHAIVVHDLSAKGCLIEHDAMLAIGNNLQIGLPGVGCRIATVVRVESGRYGCRFDAPLAPAALAEAFARDPVVIADFGPLPVPAGPYAEPVVTRWHPATRIAFLIGATSVLWTALIKLI